MNTYSVPQRTKNAVVLAGSALLGASLVVPSPWMSYPLIAVGIMLCMTWDGWYLTGVCRALYEIFVFATLFTAQHEGLLYLLPAAVSVVCWLLALGSRQFRSPENYWSAVEQRRQFGKSARLGRLTRWLNSPDYYVQLSNRLKSSDDAVRVRRPVLAVAKVAVLFVGLLMVCAAPWMPTRFEQSVLLLFGVLLSYTWDGWYLDRVSELILAGFFLTSLMSLEVVGYWRLLISGYSLLFLLAALGAKRFRKQNTFWSRFQYRRQFQPTWKAVLGAYLLTTQDFAPEPPPIHTIFASGPS